MGQNIEIVYVHEDEDYTHEALPEKVRQEFAKNAEKGKFADFKNQVVGILEKSKKNDAVIRIHQDNKFKAYLPTGEIIYEN